MVGPAKIRIHNYQSHSSANGPGLRAVLWVQGCLLGCPGCFNPETHAFTGGNLVLASKIVDQIELDSLGLEGVTISGGEPLQQTNSLVELVAGIRQRTALSTILFTGYSWEEVLARPNINHLLPFLDVVIAGRYIAENRVASHLIGSANKTLHFLTSRYTTADFQSVPQAEIFISPTGEIRLSGIDPLQW
jgi:anaerobic ribonucleoside-triphosphate reductase activating protein